MGGYLEPLVLEYWRATHNCCSKGAFSLHDCSSLTYLFVFICNDTTRRNVVVKYHCFNKNKWRIPIQWTRFERFIASSTRWFEETLKLILNMKSMKECMNIVLLTNVVFQLWQSVLFEWERCNILDGSGDIPTCLPKAISKSSFDCLENLKEIQLEKLVRGLLMKMITLKEHPNQRREAEVEVYVQVYKAFKVNGCDLKWNNDSFWSFKVDH